MGTYLADATRPKPGGGIEVYGQLFPDEIEGSGNPFYCQPGSGRPPWENATGARTLTLVSGNFDFYVSLDVTGPWESTLSGARASAALGLARWVNDLDRDVAGVYRSVGGPEPRPPARHLTGP